jgi:hypothetical protein
MFSTTEQFRDEVGKIFFDLRGGKISDKVARTLRLRDAVTRLCGLENPASGGLISSFQAPGSGNGGGTKPPPRRLGGVPAVPLLARPESAVPLFSCAVAGFADQRGRRGKP